MSTLAEDYLKGKNGSIEIFHEGLKEGQRLGQAFFNALSKKDQERVRGTLKDPFYVQHGPALHMTISFLLNTEKADDACY